MVNWAGCLMASYVSLLLAQQNAQIPLKQLDPKTRAKLLAALTALVILGFGLVVLAWLGARVTRRYMNQGSGRGPSRLSDEDDWARKPLNPPDEPSRRDEPDSP